MIKYLILFSIAILFINSLHLYGQDKARIAALETSLQNAKTDNARLQILGDLCWNYSFISFDKSLAYGQQELKLAQTMRNDTAVALAYSDIGIVYTRSNELNEALSWHQKSYALRTKLGLKDKAAASISNIAVIYKQQGNYDKALESMMDALKIYTDINDLPKKALVLNNIGLLYMKYNKQEEGKKYLLEALAIAKQLKLTALESTCYYSLGTYEYNRKNYPAALKLCLQSLDIKIKLNAQADIGIQQNTIGEIYEKQKKYPAALAWFQKSLKIREELKDQLGVASVYKNIATVYTGQGKYDDAERYLLKSISVFSKLNAKDYLQDAYLLLASNNEERKNDHSALVDYKRSIDIKDSIINRESLNKINELEIKYQTAQKEQRILLLSKQNQIQQLEINNQKLKVERRNTMMAVGIVVLLMVLAFGWLFYNSYKLKQEARLQVEIIRQQDIATQGIIAAEERERKRIAADLHDGVGQLFSAVRLNLSSLMDRIPFAKPEDKDLAERTVMMVDESCREVRTIAHQMMPNILLKTGLASAVKDFISKIDAEKLKVTLETSGLNERLDSNTEIVLYRVIQECVNNAIKHAAANRLDIQLDRNETEISVTVEDNGKGFDTSDKEKFEGIGLKNILTRLAYLKGSADFSSAPGKGTLVAIYVPLT
ncbi:sensor histidine kinase [Mucilaginibacter mali]|uniref:histidine kinase n=1 Tax=Mucilaginibacter mali TaxID=2740462 RepID=A0A7D4UPX8_9SPHI|nr:sensor histidine kinase [Mucilaginibacter mali]QKJ31380.1 sensor histidine kinase [Mucilaginibacter mali]